MQNQWSTDEVRALVLISLGMQICLIFLAPLRKRSTNMVLTLMLWLLYLTADYVATFALGNISRKTNLAESGELTVLWAPFLLIHLGGPDSITSYSVEDNELWWRHLLGLVVQRWMWIPTMLVFITGLIKFAERTHALRLGSKDNLKDKIISEIRPTNDTKKVDFISPSSDITNSESKVILEGYGWFNIFKRLLVDVTFSSNLLLQSQERFSAISTREALNLVAIELSFLSDVLHTKAVHMHFLLGRVLRFFSLVFIIAALVLFHYLDMQKHAFKDIMITYFLFGAGLTLEVIAIIILVLSDWTVVSLSRSEQYRCFASAITTTVKRITLSNGKRRWSRTIGQYNLVGLCLRDRRTVCAWIMRKLKIKREWDSMRESRSIPLPELMEDIMFTEAKTRAQNVHLYDVLVEARSYRGSKTLERHDQLETLEWSMKKEFDECIILWHLATDIWYHRDTSGLSEENNSKRDVSWNTSNYMVYLLTQQQSMMQLGYGKTRFEATCAVIKKKIMNSRGDEKLDHRRVYDVLEQNEVAALVLEQNEVAAPVLEQNEAPVAADGRQSGWRCWGKREGEEDKRRDEDEMGKLVLKEGLKLAEDLQKLDQKIKWQLISETWMEMLGYAAIHCDSYQHAKSLSRGGELLTHLWLLMSQLGVVEEHKIQQFQSGSI
ncbi:uncharacterized protein LOC144560870 [Carex rostrata]